jgi:lipoprotein NlpD
MKISYLYNNLFSKVLSVSLISLLVVSCAKDGHRAPVVEVKWTPPSKYQKQHRVTRGETLYAVAFRYDEDYRSLAALNRLRAPYTLHVGQVLQLHSIKKPMRSWKPAYKRPNIANHSRVHASKPVYVSHRRQSSDWYWPTEGRVSARFNPSQGKKGINIAGKRGDLIHASSSGVVAYSGSGLSGYGNLIIIKHNNEFLTAYGNNSKNLIKEGQSVRKGQVIAEMGMIDRQYWGVHFEIRKAGNPVNPMLYLKGNG